MSALAAILHSMDEVGQRLAMRRERLERDRANEAEQAEPAQLSPPPGPAGHRGDDITGGDAEPGGDARQGGVQQGTSSPFETLGLPEPATVPKASAPLLSQLQVLEPGSNPLCHTTEARAGTSTSHASYSVDRTS